MNGERPENLPRDPWRPRGSITSRGFKQGLAVGLRTPQDGMWWGRGVAREVISTVFLHPSRRGRVCVRAHKVGSGRWDLGL